MKNAKQAVLNQIVVKTVDAARRPFAGRPAGVAAAEYDTLDVVHRALVSRDEFVALVCRSFGEVRSLAYAEACR